MDEEQHLLTRKTLDTEPESPSVSVRTPMLAAIAGLAVIGGAVALNAAGRAPSVVNSDANPAGLAEAQLNFRVESEYTRMYGGPGEDESGAQLYPWSLLAEPHKDQTLVVGPMGGNADATYHWHVITDDAKATGQSWVHRFTSTGWHEVHLERRIATTTTHRRVAQVMVKYVKRELRSMTDADRKAFLDALGVVFRTDSDEGQQLYGKRFQGIESLVRLHLQGAADKMCDHWHDGAGIMTHHLGFTWSMELALQSVNPAVTIPYWEYTYDAFRLRTNWTESEIFDAEWFGSASPLNTEHAVKEGRWAYVPIKDNARNYSDITNPWGQLRSPWNVNDSPYFTRKSTVAGMLYSQSLPTCSNYETAFDASSLAKMQVYLNGDTHGPVHVLVGGQWGLELGDDSSNLSNERLIGPAQLLLFKDLWRRGFATCPKDCSTNEEEDCSCSCLSTTIEKVGGAYNVLTEHSGIMHWIANANPDTVRYDKETGRYHIWNLSSEEEQQKFQELLQQLCSPGSVGEMYSSAAPYDPLFWVIHTTSERLLSFKRIRAMGGYTTFNETFGYSHGSDSDSDTGVVCDWDGVQEDELPSCVKETCPGHNPDDVLPWDFDVVDSSLKEGFTNVEFYDFLNPLNEKLPYVYDNFRWNHCAAQGIHLGQGR